MLEARKFDYFEDSRERVQCICCGGSADAVLDAGLVKLGLCEECLDLVTADMVGLQGELKHSCFHCRHWQRPNDDYKHYDGRCLLQQCDASYLRMCSAFEAKEDA